MVGVRIGVVWAVTIHFMASVAPAQAPGPVGPGVDPTHDPAISSRLDGPEHGRVFYGWKGATQRLEMSAKQITVTFKADTRYDEAAQILATDPVLMPKDAVQLQEMDSASRPPGQVVDAFAEDSGILVQCEEGVTKDDVYRTIEWLRAQPEVVWASPTFRPQGLDPLVEGDVVLANCFYVTVAAGASVCAELERLLAADNLEILKKYDYSRIGRMGYRVRVPAARTEATGLDSLNYANRYHRLVLTVNAAPCFLPLYSMQMDATSDPYWPAMGEQDYETLPNGENHQGAWNLEEMNVPEAWLEVYGATGGDLAEALDQGEQVVIALLDNGVALDYRVREGASGFPTGYADQISGNNAGDWLFIDPALAPDPEDPDKPTEMGATGHLDLRGNTWLNDPELNGTPDEDDDANGYDDDIFGWDFAGGDPANIGTIQAEDEDMVPYPDWVSDPLFNINRFHGTGGAGLAAARGDNGQGLAGVCPDGKIMAVRYEYNNYVHNTDSSWRVGQAEDAILYAAGKHRDTGELSDTHADVIAFSFASRVFDPGLELAIEFANSRDIPVVVPAGNNNTSLDSYPSFPQVFPGVFCVGAVDQNRTRSFFENPDADPITGASEYGYALDFVAPSVNYKIYSPYYKPISVSGPLEGSVGTGAGTSSAYPQVAGVIALMIKAAKDTGHTPSGPEIYAILARTAQDIVYTTNSQQEPEDAHSGRDRFTGWGLPDAEAAVIEAMKPRYQVRTGDGAFLMGVDTAGDLSIAGGLEEVPAAEAAQKLLDDPNKAEWLVKDGSTGAIGARLEPDADDVDGCCLRIRGACSEGQQSLTPPTGSMIFQHKEGANTVVDGYIDKSGNVALRGNVIEFAKTDGVATVTAGPSGSGADYEGADAIQDAIDDTTNVPNHTIVEVLPGAYDPIVFPTTPVRDLVVRSQRYYDFSTVGDTIIQGNNTENNGPVIQFGGNESEECAILGFTIRGGSAYSGSGVHGRTGEYQPRSRATIMYNHFYSNTAPLTGSTWGGAISWHLGRIQLNVFGTDSPPSGWSGGNVAAYGAALFYCDGPVENNIFWYNGGAAVTVTGGALYHCHEVQSNFLAFNGAGYSGAIAYGGFSVIEGHDEIWGVVRGNIMYANTASVRGGGCTGVYGRWENNTIFGNSSPQGSGMYLGSWNATEYVNQNNILWNNGTGAEIEGTAGVDQIRYSAIEMATNPAGGGDTTNVGPWLGSAWDDVADLGFLSTAFNASSPNWAEFLHLGNSSPLRDIGQKGITKYAEEVRFYTPAGLYVFQFDFDRQWAPVEVPGVGFDYDPSDPMEERTLPMDIGADEWPTDPESFVFWWQER